jgi:septum formation protein
MEHLALASGSPRRSELLSQLGFTVAAFPSDIDESVFDHKAVADRTTLLAAAKISAALPTIPAHYRLVLGADTLIELDGTALGKAADAAEAAAMMAALAGCDHLVHSGLALYDRQSDRTWTALSTSRVSFAAMSQTEIDAYIDCGEWQGAAGAYRIQGRAALFIKSIEGSHSGIMGLPIHEFYVILSRSGYDFYR